LIQIGKYMATKRPSYLKRLKEQKRAERSSEKRDARKMRKEAKSASDDALPIETEDSYTAE